MLCTGPLKSSAYKEKQQDVLQEHFLLSGFKICDTELRTTSNSQEPLD
jgi:hypothetical protein